MLFNLFKTPVEERKRLLEDIWEARKGYHLDIDNPTTFCEKLQWYKLYYNHPDLHKIVDKITFKSYYEKKLHNISLNGTKPITAKLIKVWNSSEEVNEEDIPDCCVIKSNCRDKGQWIKIVKDKSKEDVASIVEEIKKEWFDVQKTLVNSFCTSYHNVVPKVFIEEYVDDFGKGAEECKFFCFNGEPKLLYIQGDHFQINEKGESVYVEEPPVAFMDLDWNKLDMHYTTDIPYVNPVRPPHFEDMVEISRILSKEFPFVRVDFMVTNDKLYLGELTFYPSGGFEVIEPKEWDYRLGEMFELRTV